MKKIIPMLGAYAFWGHDRYPYLLGGEITDPKVHYQSVNPSYDGEWHRGEAVFIGSYAHFFKPKFCLNAVDGAGLMKEIERLRKMEAEARRELDAKLSEIRKSSAIGLVDPGRS